MQCLHASDTAPARPEPEFVSVLAAENPAPRDGHVFMVEETHTYWCKGTRVATSVTGLLKRFFPQFDGPAIVGKNYAKWKRDKGSKYNLLIWYLIDVLKYDDDRCRQAICAAWTAAGERAAESGTAMHKDFQWIVEGLPPPQGETTEVRQFRNWLATFCENHGLRPWRAEWNIYYAAADGTVLVAGQVDLVLRHREREEFLCVDFKNKNPAPKRAGAPRTLLGEEAAGRFTEYGTGPFHEIPDTDFGKYSCQQNIYAHIAATQYGIDFRDRMYLLQIHADLDEPHIVGVERMDDVTTVLFAQLEAEAGGA